jgi:hypothetical protein
LSQIYDYPVWAGRAVPIHYALRRWLGGQDLLWIRLLNVGLSTALLAATYGFACRLLPRGRRKWAIFLMLALPFQWFVVTDYSHHLFSSFYFLACLWCGWELVFAPSGKRRGLGLSVAIGICLMLMMWQRGMHLIALGAFGVLLAWAGLSGFGWKRWGGLLLGLMGLPLLLALPAAHRFDAWLARHDVGRLNSVLPAFVARGWCPETGGEYCGRYEQLDRATPAPEKAAAMFRLVLSQIRRNPWAACGRLPVVKTGKLFLVGYASNFEESLAAERSALLPWVRGMRLAAVPAFLGLALWGCLVLALAPALQARWLPVLLAPLFTWGAYVFLGESSPRYSIFCQPFLALLGALAIGGADAAGPRPFAAAGRGLALRAALVAGLLAAARAARPGRCGGFRSTGCMPIWNADGRRPARHCPARCARSKCGCPWRPRLGVCPRGRKAPAFFRCICWMPRTRPRPGASRSAPAGPSCSTAPPRNSAAAVRRAGTARGGDGIGFRRDRNGRRILVAGLRDVQGKGGCAMKCLVTGVSRGIAGRRRRNCCGRDTSSGVCPGRPRRGWRRSAAIASGRRPATSATAPIAPGRRRKWMPPVSCRTPSC